MPSQPSGGGSLLIKGIPTSRGPNKENPRPRVAVGIIEIRTYRVAASGPGCVKTIWRSAKLGQHPT